MKPPRSARSRTHLTAMAAATNARQTNGLEETFSAQTILRNELSELQRLRNTLGHYQIDDNKMSDLKGMVNQWLADTGERLFDLTAPKN